jgi:hypothetical protein
MPFNLDMPGSQRVVDEVLSKCARHCCICRRFRPLHLQVHHIRERSEGGTDDFENAFPICISCHADVHTQTKLTRRFTRSELKAHRDAVYQLVAEGKLPTPDPEVAPIDSMSAAIIRVIRSSSKLATPNEASPLSAEAAEILVLAANSSIPINFLKYDGGLTYHVGGKALSEPGDLRTEAKYRKAMNDLLGKGLIEQIDDQLFLTDLGYTVADDLLSAQCQTEADHQEQQ